MSSKGNLPELSAEYSSEFRSVNATGIYGVVTGMGCEMNVYSEHLILDEVLETHNFDPSKTKIKRVLECKLNVSPMTMIAIRDWLEDRIKEYEYLFGSIPSAKDIEEKGKKLPKFRKSEKST